MAPPSSAAAALIHLLLIMKVVSDAVPTCNPLYGAPSPKDCAWLVNHLQRGWPPSGISDTPFFFALEGTPKPDEISDWQYRAFFEVPKIVKHGNCMMSLSPMMYANAVSWDTGTFEEMRFPGLRIIAQCAGALTTAKQGGHVAVGGALRLILTLFEPNSHMDLVYKSIQLFNADMCARVARNAAVAGSNVGGYQDCAQPLDNDDFYDFLDQVFQPPGTVTLCRGGGNQTSCAGGIGDGAMDGSSGVTS